MTARHAYKPEEAAEALGIGLTQLRELIRKGELESFQTTDGERASRRISVAAIERFIARREALERGDLPALPSSPRPHSRA